MQKTRETVKTKEFLMELFKGIMQSIPNDYDDNVDHVRFQDLLKLKFSLKNSLMKRIFEPKFILAGVLIDSSNAMDKYTTAEYKEMTKVYDLLNDEASKALFVSLIMYRILGYRKVKLPLSNQKYWDKLDSIGSHADLSQEIDPNFNGFILNLYNLSFMDIPLKMFFTAKGILTDFHLEQYAYRKGKLDICVKPGDTVIDAGGCWGDTAMYFADKAKANGEVFVFEFIPSNLILLRKNLHLNPEIEKRVTVINQPVWESSDIDVFYEDNGPASKVSFDPIEGSVNEPLMTLSIDDLVEKHDVKKVDFIKMDVEGAEPFALKGAINTIKRDKPILAIAIYHSIEDFTNIPNWINELELGYKFYLGHYTIHSEETIIFAQIEN